MPRLHQSLAAVAAALIVCSFDVTPARAGELTLSGGVFTYNDDGAATTNNVNLENRSDLTPPLSFRDTAGIALGSGTSGVCVRNSPTRVDCFVEAQRTDVFLGGGDDSLIVDRAISTGRDYWLTPVHAFGEDGADTLGGGDLGDRLDGGAGPDNLEGYPGGDSLVGGAGPDRLRGNAALSGDLLIADGGDQLDGGDGADVLIGDKGDDDLDGGAGGDRLEGGEGIDTVDYSGVATGVTVVLTAGSGDDGGPEDGPESARDTTEGVEAVIGSSGADRLVGDAAANRLSGGDGDDLLAGGRGSDELIGGGGADLASYDERVDGVTVTLDGAANDGAAGEGDIVAADVEGARGGAGPDTLVGSDGADLLEGGDGADAVNGRGGPDVLLGGAGDDSLEARDDTPERVECGRGTDRAQADLGDLLSECEIVTLPAVDRDGDGIVDPQDCNPTDPRIRPGTREVPGNAVDENCDGLRPDLSVVGSLITLFVDIDKRRGARVTELKVGGIPAGGRVEVRCKPPRHKRKACPFSRRVQRSFPSGARRANFVGLFKRKRLPAGTSIDIRVTAPEFYGKVRVERIGRSGTSRRTGCERPGSTRIVTCPP